MSTSAGGCCEGPVPNRIGSKAAPEALQINVPLYVQEPRLGLVTRNAGDDQIYSRGRWSVAISTTGGLEALQFVPCLVDAPLYGRLVSRELRERVSLGVPG